MQWIKCVRMSLSHRVRKGRQSQKDVNMWICRETSTHGKSLLCQISGCTSIQSLDCPDLITPLLAKGSLTERFLTLKSNPSQIRRWLNLIYVGFMRRPVPRHHCIPLNTGQEPLVCNLEIFNVSIIWKNPTGPVWTRLKGEWRAWNGRTAGKIAKSETLTWVCQWSLERFGNVILNWFASPWTRHPSLKRADRVRFLELGQ